MNGALLLTSLVGGRCADSSNERLSDTTVYVMLLLAHDPGVSQQILPLLLNVCPPVVLTPGWLGFFPINHFSLLA